MPTSKRSPEDPAPDELLIETARRYTRQVAGQELRHITLAVADGTKRIIDVSEGGEEWPPKEGWSVRGDRASRNGHVFQLSGKPLAVYTALVEAGDSGLTLVELNRAVWGEQADDRTAQNTISKLRRLVRKGLGMRPDKDPIEADGERYRLAVA